MRHGHGRLALAVDISLGTTAFNDAARCLKRYEYRWVDLLVPKPKDVRPALRKGVWIHRALQLHDEGQPWLEELDRMYRWAIEQGVEAESVAQDYADIKALIEDYIAYWRGNEEAPGPYHTEATELALAWHPRNDGIELTSTLDCIKRDKQGRLWIWERKSTQDIPDSDWRGVDPQTMLQYIIARANGYEVAGVVFDYILTSVGAQLRVTKAGALYKGDEERHTRMRYWAPVEAELRYKGATEEYIADMRGRVVNEGRWFQRYFAFRPDDNAMLTLRDVAAALRQIKDAREKNYYPRAMNLLDCRLFCPYSKLCFHEYQIGRKSDVYREEYTTPSTDDLYAMGRSDYR